MQPAGPRLADAQPLAGILKRLAFEIRGMQKLPGVVRKLSEQLAERRLQLVVEQALQRQRRVVVFRIKPLLVVVCVALAFKLLADPQNPLRTLIGV